MAIHGHQIGFRQDRGHTVGSKCLEARLKIPIFKDRDVAPGLPKHVRQETP